MDTHSFKESCLFIFAYARFLLLHGLFSSYGKCWGRGVLSGVLQRFLIVMTFRVAEGSWGSAAVVWGLSSYSSWALEQRPYSLWLTDLDSPWHVRSFWTRDGTHVSCTGRCILHHWITKKALYIHFRWEQAEVCREWRCRLACCLTLTGSPQREIGLEHQRGKTNDEPSNRGPEYNCVSVKLFWHLDPILDFFFPGPQFLHLPSWVLTRVQCICKDADPSMKYLSHFLPYSRSL